MSNNRNGRPFTIIIIAITTVLALSLLPWGKLTGNFFKDFNLLEDISREKTIHETEELIDPELLALMQDNPDTDSNKPAQNPDRAQASMPQPDTISTHEPLGQPADTAYLPAEVPPVPETAPRKGDMVMIEDYTTSGNGLANLRKALTHTGRPARVAIIGDSYIEGDVFSQNVREYLQQAYGGRGVGYMGLHSDIPGFRQSVRQGGSGWSAHDVRHTRRMAHKWLPGEYFTGSQGAKATYKGVSKLPHASAWNNTRFLFIAPSDGTITINGEKYPVTASDNVQCIEITGETSSVSITNGVPGITGLGVWLNDDSGITLDCMSLRGNSGISHTTLNEELSAQVAEFISYDLIIVEYGINALTSSQKDYSKYTGYMENVIRTLRRCHPQADILLMGIGDRGQKRGGAVHSLPTCRNMVDAQRNAARNTRILFWDTREAMGGEDAVVAWRNDRLVNADYIHLNHKGGEVLGKKLADAIIDNLNRL